MAALALAFHWQPSEIRTLAVGELKRYARRAAEALRGRMRRGA